MFFKIPVNAWKRPVLLSVLKEVERTGGQSICDRNKNVTSNYKCFLSKRLTSPNELNFGNSPSARSARA